MDAHQNPNLCHPTSSSTSSSQYFKKTHEDFFVKNLEGSSGDHEKDSFLAAAEGGHNYKPERSTSPPSTPPASAQPEALGEVVEESVREKLKRNRVEMSGRVCIPDIWGQEDLLKNWIDCTVFDSSLDQKSIMSAREALIEEGRSTLGIENSC